MLQERQGDGRIPPGQAEQPAEHGRPRLFDAEGLPRPAAVETHEVSPAASGRSSYSVGSRMISRTPW